MEHTLAVIVLLALKKEVNNMKGQFTSYEVAKLMKELGFNEPCSAYYRNLIGSSEHIFFDSITLSETNKSLSKSKSLMFSAPTYKQVIDWILLKGYVVAYKSDKTILDNDLLVMLEYLLKKEQTEE